MGKLEISWNRAWTQLGLRSPVGLFEQLLQAYREPQRHYHSLQHLEECVGHFSAASHLATHPGEVEIALWFHDAIYELQSSSNEQRSAEWAVSSLKEAQASHDVQDRVHALILATRHDTLPIDADQQLLVDIDLAILGSATERFAEYDKQVRMEYSWIPELLYNAKRKAVLSRFLARQHIYNTGYFRDRYETQARANLAAAVAGLVGQP